MIQELSIILVGYQADCEKRSSLDEDGRSVIDWQILALMKKKGLIRALGSNFSWGFIIRGSNIGRPSKSWRGAEFWTKSKKAFEMSRSNIMRNFEEGV